MLHATRFCQLTKILPQYSRAIDWEDATGPSMTHRNPNDANLIQQRSSGAETNLRSCRNRTHFKRSTTWSSPPPSPSMRWVLPSSKVIAELQVLTPRPLLTGQILHHRRHLQMVLGGRHTRTHNRIICPVQTPLSTVGRLLRARLHPVNSNRRDVHDRDRAACR